MVTADFAVPMNDHLGPGSLQNITPSLDIAAAFDADPIRICMKSEDVFLHASLGNPPWHVAEWGTITINPLATAARRVNRGETPELAVRIVAHDGDADQAGITELYEAFKKR